MPDPSAPSPADSRSGTTLELPPVDTGSGLRRAFSLVRLWSSTPGVQPASASDKFDRFLYGFSQPLLGVRVMLRDRTLLGEGLAPSILIAGACAALSYVRAEGVGEFLSGFMLLLAGLAPVPPFLFARYYARIAAKARNKMGFGPVEPYLKPVLQSAIETLKMLVILAIGVAPLTFVLSLVPVWGGILTWVLSALWSLHWIVVEGYDNARTLAPGDTVEEREAAGHALKYEPAFLRWTRQLPGPLRVVFLPARMVAEVVHTLSKEWLPEIVEVERTPQISAGFGLGVALLLAIPGLNILFRPAVAIGGVHLRARLEHERSVP